MNDRIANAFRCPQALTEADYVKLAALWKRDAATANKRRKRLQNTGGTDLAANARRNELARQKRHGLAAE
jgi:hypothetical protein